MFSPEFLSMYTYLPANLTKLMIYLIVTITVFNYWYIYNLHYW